MGQRENQARKEEAKLELTGAPVWAGFFGSRHRDLGV